MSDPANLNRFRKERQRAEKKARADQNALFHGLSKAEKTAAAKERARQSKTLDLKRRDHEAAPKKPK